MSGEFSPESLRADCARCFGLCCVVPGFSASADFAIDKPAGTPCPNLRDDFRCGIHGQLRLKGFSGCVAYDCFGAGQKVCQVTFGGRDWRHGKAPEKFEAFGVMRQLHELIFYTTEALALPPADSLHDGLRSLRRDIDRLTREPADALRAIDVGPYWERASALLRRASELARAGLTGVDRQRADLTGADLRGADLAGANLRGARLLGADLRGADMRRADLLGADLRGARLGGADLTASIFLIQSQLESAHGDPATRLPASLRRPAHWHADADAVRGTTVR